MGGVVMAKPIKETPVLKDKEAVKFVAAASRNESDTSNRVSRESYEKSKKLYQKVLTNATF